MWSEWPQSGGSLDWSRPLPPCLSAAQYDSVGLQLPVPSFPLSQGKVWKGMKPLYLIPSLMKHPTEALLWLWGLGRAVGSSAVILKAKRT